MWSLFSLEKTRVMDLTGALAQGYVIIVHLPVNATFLGMRIPSEIEFLWNKAFGSSL